MASVAQSNSRLDYFSSGSAITLNGVTAGRPLVLGIGLERWFGETPAITSITGGGATWTVYTAATKSEMGGFFAVGVGGTGGNISVTINGDFNGGFAFILEIADADETTPYDTHTGQNTGTGSTPYDVTSGATGTLATDNGLKIGLFGFTQSSQVVYEPKSGDGDTELAASISDLGLTYQALSSTAAVQARWTVTDQSPGGTWPVGVLVIRGASGGATPVALAGSLSFSGGLAGQQDLSRSVGGALSFSGAVAERQSLARQLAGVLAMDGDVIAQQFLQRDVAGSVGFSGAIAAQQDIQVDLAGQVGFSGALTPVQSLARGLAGQVGFAGEISHKFDSKHLFGALSFQGDVAGRQSLFRDIGGSVGFSGAIAALQDLQIDLAGDLTVTGNLNKDTSQAVGGSIDFAGAIGDKIQVRIVGSHSTSANGGSTGLTYSHTVVSGTTCLVVTVETRNAPVTGVTWNGNALTQAIESVLTDRESSIWYLASPTAATGDVVVSCTASGSGIRSGATNLANTDATSPVRDTLFSSGTTSVTGTVDSDTVDLVIDALLGPDNGTGDTPTIGADQTQLHMGLANDTRGASSWKRGGDGSTTMGWTTLRSEAWRYTMASFRPPAQPAPPLAGEIGFSATLAPAQSLFRDLTGQLSFTGQADVYRSAVRLAGEIGFTGSISAFSTAISLAGQVGFAGDLAKNQSLARALAGTLGFQGTISAQQFLARELSGQVGFTGILFSDSGVPLTGSLTMSGALAEVIYAATPVRATIRTNFPLARKFRGRRKSI